jgi:hypothetical protein
VCEDLESALSSDDIATIKGMLARGDASSDVAYWFGTCEREIERIITTESFAKVAHTEQSRLPPPGPYPSISDVAAAFTAIKAAVANLNTARKTAGLPPIKFKTSNLTVSGSNQHKPGIAPDKKRESSGRSMLDKPRGYQPPPVRPNATRPTQRDEPETLDPAKTERVRPLPIHVRLLREKGNFIRVSLLPRRNPDCPSTCQVIANNEAINLQEMTDAWYEDVHPEQIGKFLSQGIAWTLPTEGVLPTKWLLSGRNIYVLAPPDDLSGLVDATRLSIGIEQGVLVTKQVLDQALAIIRETGSPDPLILAETQGAPDGWVAMLGVRPKIHLDPKYDGIFDILRPQVDIEIHLSGGIRLARSGWLHGRPPTISLVGNEDPDREVLIDGVAATKSDDGSYTAPGWDGPGQHSIWCAGRNCTYEILIPDEKWDLWPAHDKSRAILAASDGAICGAQLFLPESDHTACAIVPASHRLVIGLEPGQFHICPDSRVGFCVALTRFPAAFALPLNSSSADKTTTKIIALNVRETLSRTRLPASLQRNVRYWSSAILNANRKRLTLQAFDSHSQILWDGCVSLARSIRRRHK